MQINNPGIFSIKPMGSEVFHIRMVKTLGIIIHSRPKERPRKMEN